MTDNTQGDHPDDSELVAYLDGELPETERGALVARLRVDAALQRRLDYLATGGRPFTAAFGALLTGAPTLRLQGLLAQPRIETAPAGPNRRRLVYVAAGLLVFAAGATLGFGLPLAFRQPDDIVEPVAADGWREVVAEYLTLYTSETLADIPEDAAQQARELSLIAGKLAIGISPEKIALPDLAFKRAQLFDFDGRPLAQIAYLSRHGPVAFCVTKNELPDAGREFEERHGQSIVYWSKGGYAFMLIGRMPKPQLDALAATLEQRVS
jgi:anti-sigma factor RsiW